MNRDRNIALYRALSALYPQSFRDEYGDDLVATFAEQLSDDRLAVVWWTAIRDLAVSIPTQHMEARVHRPAPRTVAVVATASAVAAFVLAIVAGTGFDVGVFLLAAAVSLVIATLAWTADRRIGSRSTMRWRSVLGLGIALLAATIVVINVPPYDERELPEAGWFLMMLSMVTGVALIIIGLTIGIARRSAHRAATG